MAVCGRFASEFTVAAARSPRSLDARYDGSNAVQGRADRYHGMGIVHAFNCASTAHYHDEPGPSNARSGSCALCRRNILAFASMTPRLAGVNTNWVYRPGCEDSGYTTKLCLALPDIWESKFQGWQLRPTAFSYHILPLTHETCSRELERDEVRPGVIGLRGVSPRNSDIDPLRGSGIPFACHSQCCEPKL